MTRNWNILDWNIRGINSQERWDDIRQRINERNCNIICFQETKREHFDHAYLKNFCPRRFNQFAYAPSIGNSGGIITVWNGNLFDRILIDSSKHHVTVHFTYKLSGKAWYLTNIYGPAHNEGRAEFIQWLDNLNTTNMMYWMIIGDFNLIRAPSDIDMVEIQTTLCPLIM